MKYYIDPYGRLRTSPISPAARQPRTAPTGPASGNSGQGTRPPTVEDYQRLAQAYEDLRSQFEEEQQSRQAVEQELAELKRDLAIKDEALQRQSADMKQMEAELVWARAAAQQEEKAAQSPDGGDEGAWRERYMSLQTELENLRSRWEQRYANETAGARQEILRDMLSLADNLELALRHGEELQGEQAQKYVQNIGVTHQAFLATLRRYGVAPIEAQGQPFDPNLHEAVGSVQDANVPSGHVTQVIQTGYMEEDRLLRPARVLVSE